MRIDAREPSFANRGWQVRDCTTDKLMTDVVWINNTTAQYGEYYSDSKGRIEVNFAHYTALVVTRQASRIVISGVGRVVFINAPADKSEAQLLEAHSAT